MDVDLQDLMEIALGTRHEDPIDFEVDVLQPAVNVPAGFTTRRFKLTGVPLHVRSTDFEQ